MFKSKFTKKSSDFAVTIPKGNFTILSAELSTLSEPENLRRSLLLRDMLTDAGIDFVEAKGCYKGSEEISFITSTPSPVTFGVVNDFAFKNFNQESVLYVDKDRIAHLMYKDNFETETIGTFSQINPKRVEELDAYTIVDNTLYSVI